MLAIRVGQERSWWKHVLIPGVYQLFASAAFIGAKNSALGATHKIDEASARYRRQQIPGNHSSGSAPQSRNAPHFFSSKISAVIDFRAVGGKTARIFVAFIICELQRFAARGQHHEHLQNAIDRRSE